MNPSTRRAIKRHLSVAETHARQHAAHLLAEHGEVGAVPALMAETIPPLSLLARDVAGALQAEFHEDSGTTAYWHTGGWIDNKDGSVTEWDGTAIYPVTVGRDGWLRIMRECAGSLP